MADEKQLRITDLTNSQIALLCDIGELHLPSLPAIRNATWSG
jgi:hypothetical protein